MFFLGIDVGTSSARAAIFDAQGTRLGMGVRPIQVFKPAADHYEHSSEDVWRACAEASRAAVRESCIDPEKITGVGFDATCSLVVVGGGAVSPGADAARDTIVWMDHRAIAEADFINSTGHE